MLENDAQPSGQVKGNQSIGLTALDYVKARAKREWDYTHSRGLFAWLSRHLGTMKPVSGVWIRQYATGDWDKTHFKGQVEQVWRYDANGFALVDHVPELDRSNSITSTTPVISFCLDEAARRMIYHEWTGGRAGFGAILALSEDGKWVTEKTLRIS